MKKTPERSVKQRRAAKKASGPIRWDEIPHQEIWARAQEKMSFGSRSWASGDSIKHVLKRRLYRLDPADHLRYVELECARIVETLRMVRDEYRPYLEDRGCAPLVDMYWVVLRYGVKDWAVMLLRSVAFEYIGLCRIKAEIWNELFNPSVLGRDLFPNEDESTPKPSIIMPDDKLMKTITGMLGQDVFDLVQTGGPFGKDAQFFSTYAHPGKRVLLEQETFFDALRRRKALWDDTYPWTECLAQMFDAAQEEIFSQWEELGNDAKRVEAQFIKLSPFQRIAHKHLVSLRSGDVANQSTGSSRWLSLLRELDDAHVSLDSELQGKARAVLMTLRKKGSRIETWEACYDSKAGVILDDGKRYGLRREVTHAIHNAAKKTAYHLGKIWNLKRPS